jgi:2',3'-cyclic-nucleotide 2'-phosphodiesterase (5'-nucleotidase family)
VTLRFLHTNDLHGRLAEREADTLRMALAERSDTIYLDSGDAVSAGNLGVRMGGEPVLRHLSDLGCRALTLGNRETHPKAPLFFRKVADARFPLLCANLEPREGVSLPTLPHVFFEVAGARVAVFGVTIPMFTRQMWTSALCDMLFTPPLEAAAVQVAALRSQCDLLVALTHIGLKHDQGLAERCPKIDLILGGHTHADLPEPVVVNGVPIVQNPGYGATYSLLDVDLIRGSHPRITWERRPLRKGAR